eukprot:1361015-Karenia_brevis.AAC.1
MGSDNWDVIMFNETWRTQREEDEELLEGHRWLGSGGALKQGALGGKHGVGLLINARWATSVQR